MSKRIPKDEPEHRGCPFCNVTIHYRADRCPACKTGIPRNGHELPASIFAPKPNTHRNRFVIGGTPVAPTHAAGPWDGNGE